MRWPYFLRVCDHVSEPKFWTPSGAGFQALTAGGPILFKTHDPDDRFGGGGFLSAFVKLKVSEASRFFGEGNGRASRQEMLVDVNMNRRAGLRATTLRWSASFSATCSSRPGKRTGPCCGVQPRWHRSLQKVRPRNE